MAKVSQSRMVLSQDRREGLHQKWSWLVQYLFRYFEHGYTHTHTHKHTHAHTQTHKTTHTKPHTHTQTHTRDESEKPRHAKNERVWKRKCLISFNTIQAVRRSCWPRFPPITTSLYVMVKLLTSPSFSPVWLTMEDQMLWLHRISQQHIQNFMDRQASTDSSPAGYQLQI